MWVRAQGEGCLPAKSIHDELGHTAEVGVRKTMILTWGSGHGSREKVELDNALLLVGAHSDLRERGTPVTALGQDVQASWPALVLSYRYIAHISSQSRELCTARWPLKNNKKGIAL